MIIDLQNDYKKLMIEKIKKSGLKIPVNYDVENIIVKYFAFLRKKEFAGPHEIKRSKNFHCPPKVLKGFSNLENIIRNGGDITPYFNRAAFDLGRFDDMFSDWGIMHFHLGDKLIDGEHLVERDDFVLFAYLHKNVVYFINIFRHGHWADSDVIQEMYNNWPSLIDRYGFKGFSSIPIENKHRRVLRESGINTPVQIKDSDGNPIISSSGLGITSVRTSITDSMAFINANNTLGKLQLYLLSQEEQIKSEIQKNGYEIFEEIQLELIDFNPTRLYIQELKYNWSMEIPLS